MKKRRKIFFVLVTLILVAGVAAVGLYEVGDRVLDNAFDSYASGIENALEQAEDDTAAYEGASAPSKEGIQPKPSPNTDTKTQRSTSTDVQQQNTPMPAAPSKAQANEQYPTTQQPTKDSIPSIQMTKDKIEDIKASVTPNDKMAAATLVLSRLSQSDINHLTKLAAGGITPEEKAEIKAIVYSRFTQAEIEKIKEMYLKYMSK